MKNPNSYTPMPDEIMDAANLSNSHFNAVVELKTELETLKAVDDRYSVLANRIDDLSDRLTLKQRRFDDAVEWTGTLIARNNLMPE